LADNEGDIEEGDEVDDPADEDMETNIHDKRDAAI